MGHVGITRISWGIAFCIIVFLAKAHAFDPSDYIHREIATAHRAHIEYKEAKDEFWQLTVAHIPYSFDPYGLFFNSQDMDSLKSIDTQKVVEDIKLDNLSYINDVWELRKKRAFELEKFISAYKLELYTEVLGYSKQALEDPGFLYQLCNDLQKNYHSNTEEHLKKITCYMTTKILTNELQINKEGFEYVYQIILNTIDFYTLSSNPTRLAESFMVSYFQQLDPHSVFAPSQLPEPVQNAPYDPTFIFNNYTYKIFNHSGYNIGYVQLRDFRENSAAIIYEHLKRMLKEVYVGGIILDLRGNPGGYVSEAANIIRFFSDDAELFYLEHSEGTTSSAGSQFSQMILDFNLSWSLLLKHSFFEALSELGSRNPYKGKLIILVDEESASASELVSGSLQAMGRAIVVGSQRTFGKGTGYENIYPSEDELKNSDVQNSKTVTGLYYYFTDGGSPQAVGVRSDIVLSRTPRLNFESSLYRPLGRRSAPDNIKNLLRPRPKLSELSALVQKSYDRRGANSLNSAETLEESLNIMADWLYLSNSAGSSP